jgi:hypothetical protein
MAYRDETHPHNLHASKSRTRPSAPTSSPVGRRRRSPRLAGATLAPAVDAGSRDYDIAGGARVASRETHRESTILRGLSVGGAPSRLQPTAPGDVFRQVWYSAGLTHLEDPPRVAAQRFFWHKNTLKRRRTATPTSGHDFSPTVALVVVPCRPRSKLSGAT